MSDTKSNSQQQTIVIALVAIAVLLAALVGVIIFQQMQASKLASAGTPTAADTSAGTGSTQLPAAATAATPFDPKTATKVPAGMTPVQLVKAYNEDVVAGKYDVAYKLLPIDKQKSYGDPTAYATQLKSYGITGYKIGTAVETADSVSVAAEQDTPQMPITYTWTFKKVSGTWYVASRNMGGTVQ